jgi:uncharacterized protein (TIGR03437 family)
LTVVPVLNAASYSPAVLAPDAIATIFGSGSVSTSSGSARAESESSLQDTTVRIIDSAGIGYTTQLFFVSPTQINFLMPSGITLGPAMATIVDSNGGASLAAFTVARIAPGMFAANSTGMGAASALMVRVHPDGSQDPRVNVVTYDSVAKAFVPRPLSLEPETDRVFLEVYVTGIRHSSNVIVTINGQSIPVLYAGQHGQFAGLDQINLELPASLKGAGEVQLKISADGQISNSVTVVIK